MRGSTGTAGNIASISKKQKKHYRRRMDAQKALCDKMRFFMALKRRQ